MVFLGNDDADYFRIFKLSRNTAQLYLEKPIEPKFYRVSVYIILFFIVDLHLKGLMSDLEGLTTFKIDSLLIFQSRASYE